MPEHALDLMRQQLPAELLEALDPDSLREDPTHYIDDALAETRSDVLYTATLRGAPVLIYVLIEHQSTQDPLMPFRLLRYVVRIWERWVAAATAASGVAPTALPPVIPFVLHQGPRPWSTARSLAELVPLPDALAPFVRPLLPGLDLSVLDLGAGGFEALAAWEARPVVKVTLAVMRGVVDPAVDVLDVLVTYTEDLVLLLERPEGRRAFAVLIGYIVRRRRGLDVAALAAKVADLVGPKAGDVVMSTAQELIDQGVRQEREQTLLRQLRVKFGRLPDEVKQRLAKASLEDLGRWTEQILVAERLEDVFTTARGGRPRRSGTRRPRKS